MKKLFVLVALIGMLAVGWPVTPVGADVGQITDPDTDGANAAGDIIGGSLTHESTVTVRVTVQTPEDPNTDANWVDGDSFILWSLDTDSDAAVEWEVEFFSAGTNDLVGAVFVPGGGQDPECEGTASFVNNGYQVSFPRSCIGNPADIQFFAELEYDPTPGTGTDNQLDRAPNEGFSAAVAGPAATPPVDRAVRAAVVGQGDNALYSGHDLAGFYEPLGGQLVGTPAVSRIAKPNLSDEAVPVYVGTGTDNAIWARTTALGWRRISVPGTVCKGGPGALVYTDAQEDQQLVVACRGTDDALYRASGVITPTTIPDLGGWTRLGGILRAPPAIGISQDKGDAVTFLVVGQDGRVYENTGAGYAARPWLCSGHVAFNTLNDTSWFGCRGTDNALWAAENTSSGWGNPFSLGGILNDGPGVAVTGTSAVFFVQGTDNVLYSTIVQNVSHERSPFAFFGGRIKFGVNATAL